MKYLGGFTAIRLIAVLLMLPSGFAPSAVLAQDQPVFSQRQLDQMLAPIALYPDPLLSQMFMASTYPVELAEAARWSRMHPELQGDDAVQAVAQEDWDPSVKSLVAFPQVLAWMDENPEWTRTLGDAFLAQEPQVMETVQNLRQRANYTGTLRSDDRIHVVEDGRTISVLPANRQIIYVPYYDPMVVYGTWWWPAYPPAYWRPRPGYFIQPGYARFYWGPGIVISTGFFFGACDWHRRQVHVVNVNNYYYRTMTVNRPATVGSRANVAALNQAPGAWQHDPAHRRGMAYRGPAAQRYSWVPAQRQEPRPDDRTQRVQPPHRRGESTQLTDPRSNARVDARQTTAGSAAVRTNEIRPEVRPTRPAAGAAPANSPEAARARETRPEFRLSQPAVRTNAANPPEAARASESRPEFRLSQPAVRTNAANPPEAPRGRHWRSEPQPSQPQLRREAATRFDPPRSIAPRAEVRAGRESPGQAAAGMKSEVRNPSNREPGKSTGHRDHSTGKGWRRGGHD